MPRVSQPSQAQQGEAIPKRRRFFSTANLPPLPIARAPSPPRPITSDRVLAALKTDERAVTAAKTFVKEKMGDDKWDVADRTRVTRGASSAAAIANGIPPTKRHATSSAPLPRKTPAAKVLPKSLATGSTAGSIAQRIKAKGAAIARKVTLRSRVAPQPSPVAPTAPEPHPIAGPSNHKKAKETAIPDGGTKHNEDDSSPDDQGGNVYEPNPGKRKEFLESGLYCQDENPAQERMLYNRVLDFHNPQPKKRGPGRPRKSAVQQSQLPPIATPEGEPVSFPPLPLEYHFNVFFGEEEHEFRLPYNIIWESETGVLDGKKRPPFYQKIRSNQFVERPKNGASVGKAVCHCDPEVGCGDNCMNFVMNYLCGSGCPCGDQCGNKSLAKRKGKATKVVWTGTRGFGLFAAEDIKEGEFVADYRGEIIHIDTFIDRIGNTYKGKRNFYALAYDRDEVIDAGMRGNDTRFINHGCNPNLEVRKYCTVGDGFEEYEVGMWAIRDIKAGEELFYNYNFDSFAVTVNRDDDRQKCMCGAPNCVGFLGRKAGEKSAKELAADLAAKAARVGKGKRAAISSRRASLALSKRESSTKSDTVLLQRELSLASKRTSSAPATTATGDEETATGLRGRPKSIAQSEQLPTVPVKRRPGRPRKNPEPIIVDTSQSPDIERAELVASSTSRPASFRLAWPSWNAGSSSPSVSNPDRIGSAAPESTPGAIMNGDSPRSSSVLSEASSSDSALTEPPATAVVTPGTGSTGDGNLTGTPDTILKRKRGRPPKSSSVDVLKRPRGRPRIHPLPDPATQPTRRPRGRPPKQPRPSDPAMTESPADNGIPSPASVQPKLELPTITPAVAGEGTPVIKRPRGRPPKVRPAPYAVPSTANPTTNGGRLHKVGAAIEAVVQNASSSIGSSIGSLKLKFTLPTALGKGEAAEQVTVVDNASAPAAMASDTAVTSQTPKQTPKQVEKARRNGAPAGWVFIPAGAPIPEPEPSAAQSDRAARLAARRGQ